MFAPRIAFVDLETTGSAPPNARITEVGIVLVETGPAGERVTEWSSLVKPGCPIPANIQRLTGITNRMVCQAPSFAELAPALAEQLADVVFVAHNARFDYGFLRAEFARVGIDFSAPTLCTVQLSRHLYPAYGSHSLDAIIDRFGLAVADRHRALGDARLTLAFVRKLYQRLAPAVIEAATARLLKRPSTPSPLPAGAIDELPPAPGVYLFYGAGEALLYIGKSLDLRQRVAAHFSSGHSHAREQALAAAVHRIEWETTAGEFGALLREAQLIQTRRPAHNLTLRASPIAHAIVLDESGRARFVPLSELGPALLHEHHGPFASRSVARSMLVKLAHEHTLCLRTLGLEKRSKADAADTPCLARPLRHCRGACEGLESPADHTARVRAAMAAWRIARWPHPGAIALVERDPMRCTEDWHVFDHWAHLGSVKSLAAAADLAASAPRVFDADAYRLARLALSDKPAWALELVAL
ncbi:MAG: exonuclease domain-containing protein [Burkholderiaceae bacterium]